MMGYIIASVITTVFRHATVCMDLLCWRWPFLIEVMLLSPLYLGLYFIPREDISVMVNRPARSRSGSTCRRSRTRTASRSIDLGAVEGGNEAEERPSAAVAFAATDSDGVATTGAGGDDAPGAIEKTTRSSNTLVGGDEQPTEKTTLMQGGVGNGIDAAGGYYDTLKGSPSRSPVRNT